MDESSDFKPDGPMSPEQQALAASLPPEMIRKIDEALLSNATSKTRKVAMLVGLTMENPEVRVPGLPDILYASRVKALVAQGSLVTFGDLDCMRYSEVKLAK